MYVGKILLEQKSSLIVALWESKTKKLQKYNNFLNCLEIVYENWRIIKIFDKTGNGRWYINSKTISKYLAIASNLARYSAA